MIRHLAICLAGLLPQETPQVPVGPRGVATLYHGGRIHLGDDKGTVVEALLERYGTVEAVGSLEDLRALEQDEEWLRVDLQGGTAVPGLQDAHVDLVALGAVLEGDLDLSGCKDEAALVAAVKEWAADRAPGSWIVARGWNSDGWSEGSLPDHTALSEALPENPVALFHADGHVVLCNRMALRAVGLLDVERLPRVEGGLIAVDEEGRPTGVLVDAAAGLLKPVLPQPSLEKRRARLLRVQEHLLGQGLTAVHAMDVDAQTLSILADLRREGLLRMRVLAYLSSDVLGDDDRLGRLPGEDVLSMLAVRGVYIEIDGTFAGHGAALLDPYADRPKHSGRMRVSAERLAEQLIAAARAELQPAIAARGDRANRTVLDVLEGLRRALPELSRLRPRVEYAHFVSTKDWPRFPQLQVVPSLKPETSLSRLDGLLGKLGVERVRELQAWRELAPGLGRLALGSGAPEQSANPLDGMQALRRPREFENEDAQPVDGIAALSGYTVGPSYAGGEETRRGRLLPGYACDVTVFDRDPLELLVEELPEARVQAVVVNGRPVFQAER